MGRNSQDGNLMDMLSKIGSSFKSLICGHLRLALIEFREERTFIMKVLLISFISLVTGFIGITGLFMWILFAMPSNARFVLLGVMAVICLIACIAGVIWLRANLNRHNFFAESRRQLINKEKR